MAARYWVGGTAAWDATAGTKWALTSGGAGGQAVPTSADTVFFDAASGASTVTIGAGTAVCSTLTCTGFTGTLAFGTNSIDLAGTGTIYTGAVGGTLITGTPLMLCSNATATFRSVSASPTSNSEANAISFNITAGSGLIQWGTNQGVRNITFSGTFTGSTGGGFYCYGNLTLKTGMTVPASATGIAFVATSGTQQITSAALTLDFPIIFQGTATYQLQDALSVGAASGRTVTLTSGTLDLNNNNFTIYGGFVGSGAVTRTIAFGTGQFYLTALTGTVWSVSGTLLTITGTSPTVNATGNATTGERDIVHVPTTVSSALAININITAGSADFGFGSGSQLVNNSNFTGFSGRIGNAGLSAACRFNAYGNITMGTGMTTVGAVSEVAWQLLGTGTQLITSNGVAFSSPFDLGGTGSYSLQDAFVTGATRQITLGTGTLVTNGFNVTCGTFNYNNATTKAMNFGTSTITILAGSSTSGFQGSNAGTTYTDVANSTIVFTSTSTTCFSGGQGGGTGNQFGTVTMSGLRGTLNLGGGSTVAKCTTLNNTVSPCTFTNSCTTGFTVTNFNVDGTAGNLVTLNSATPGTARTISQTTGTVDARYMSIKDSTATGGATWNASNSVAGPNNTGWNFLASTNRLRLVSTGTLYTVTAELDEVTTPNISMSLSKFNSTEFDEGGYNLYLNTVDFNATSWSFNNGTITRNTTVAPNGTTTAATITGSSATVPYLSSSESIVSGTTYTFSVYAQAGTQSRVMMLLYGVNFNNGGANQSVTFDLSLGTIISTAASPQGYGIQFIGSGWYRIYITGTATTTTADNTQLVRFQDGIYVSGNYAYVWGPQCEPGTQPNFYVPTTTTISIPPPMRYTNGNIVQVSTEFDEVTTIS